MVEMVHSAPVGDWSVFPVWLVPVERQVAVLEVGLAASVVPVLGSAVFGLGLLVWLGQS